MNTFLCNTCGERIDETVRNCPRCGAVNYNCKEVRDVNAAVIMKTVADARKYHIGMKIASLILGFIFMIVGFVLISLGLEEEYMFIVFDAFMCTLGGACAVVFSIIGLTRKEFTTVVSSIALGVSLFSIITVLPMLSLM